MPQRSSGRFRGDDGAVLVEFALVAPLLLVLVFGLIDYGRMLNDDNTLTRTVQSAARTGAGQGTDRFADYNIVQSIEASLATLDGSTIERVVVFKSTTADGVVPAACRDLAIVDNLNAKGVSTGGVRCNIYSKAQIEFRGNLLTRFPSTSGCVGGWDAAWCPTTRSRGTDLTDPDFLGVYVKLKTTALTGIVGLPTQTLSSTSVFRLDPCITGVSCD